MEAKIFSWAEDYVCWLSENDVDVISVVSFDEVLVVTYKIKL